MLSGLRHRCRIAAANVLYACGLLGLWRFVRAATLGRRGACILALHRVLKRGEMARAHSLSALILSEEAFRKLLEHLRGRFQVVSLREVVNGESVPRLGKKPLCVLTFDDGWRDNFTTAFPLLKSFGMPATVFLATGYIGKQEVFWVEQLRSALERRGRDGGIPAEIAAKIRKTGRAGTVEDLIEYLKHMPADERSQALDQILSPVHKLPSTNNGDAMLSWEEVAEMQRQGIEFGSHTETHPLLTYEGDATVDRELRRSFAAIQERLGQPPSSFAYPNGDWDGRIRRAVREAGYECALTTERGWYGQEHDRYTIPRITLHDGNVTGADGKFSAAVFSLMVSRFV
jgi:peptidoglycan/xylan/chitin deacetylase (PgdA/CDA1 family)